MRFTIRRATKRMDDLGHGDQTGRLPPKGAEFVWFTDLQSCRTNN